MYLWMKSAAHQPRVPEDRIDPVYRRLRWQVFSGIFVGYAGYYLVRKNFSLAMPHLAEQGVSVTQLGDVAAGVPIAYGLSKFLMGSVCDKSNPRYFMAIGLIASSVIMFAFGLVPSMTNSLIAMFVLMLLNGWVQGMGWPASGKTMVHWFSTSERGTWMALWNVAHNIGAGVVGPLAALGIILFADWHAVFYVPAAVAMLAALFVLVTVRDTPQSQGLPPIEEYHEEHPRDHATDTEDELPFAEIFKSVLCNKWLWSIAIANAFVYFVRYGVGDWVPLYLAQEKDFEIAQTGWAFMAYEFGGIPGTIACGWISDRFFQGRRAPAGILFMLGVLVAVIVYWLNPKGQPGIDIACLITIGLLIYGPVMLIGLQALDMARKKAAAAAAGFTGLFGYVIGAVAANALMGRLVHRWGWDGGFYALIIACVLAIAFMAITWNHGGAVKHRPPQQA